MKLYCCMAYYHRSATFHIFILEQSLDGCKFNRGKLLNAGFDMACNDYDVYIFHDVDLLPAVRKPQKDCFSEDSASDSTYDCAS